MADPVTIATFDRVGDADAARLALEQAGITAYLDSANLVAANFLLSNAVGGIKLFVAADDAPAAQKILADDKPSRAVSKGAIDSSDSKGEITFKCEECGRSVCLPLQLAGRCEVCPHCGEYIDVPEAGASDATRVVSPTSDSDSSVDEPVAPSSSNATSAASRGLPGGDWFEVLVVLCVAYVPNLFSAIAYLVMDQSTGSSEQVVVPWYDYSTLLLNSLIICVVVLYFAWRNGDSWSSIGVQRFRLIRDPVLAVCCLSIEMIGRWLLWVVAIVGPRPTDFVHTGGASLVERVGSMEASEFAAHVWFIAAILVSAYAEELLYRGYLIIRLGSLLQSSWIAALVAAGLFATIHAYHGFNGALSTFFFGLIYGGFFLCLRRLWPLAIAHALYNLWVSYY